VWALGGMLAGLFSGAARFVATLITVVAAWMLAVLHDLARLHCVQREHGALRGMAHAVLAVAARPLRLPWAALWRSVTALVALVGAAWATFSVADTSPLAALLLAQLGLAVVVLLRGDWLRVATRLADPSGG
jgi:hypothetical protein